MGLRIDSGFDSGFLQRFSPRMLQYGSGFITTEGRGGVGAFRFQAPPIYP